MLRAFKIVLLMFTLTLAACETTGNHQNYAQQAYDRESERIESMVKNNELTRAEGNNEMLAVVKTYYPNDQLLIGTWEYIISIHKQYEDGKLTKEKYNALVAAAWSRTGEAANLRMQNHESQQRAAAAAIMLQTMPQQTRCTSYMMGRQLMTDCR